jgi:Ca2+-binding RTX toxin-like protein
MEEVMAKSSQQVVYEAIIQTIPAPDYYTFGGSGIDYQEGTTGDDLLMGGDGGDIQLGGKGDDTIVGEGGDDNQTGGTGVDWFYINTNDGHDIISDFRPEQGDRIFLYWATLNDMVVAENGLTASPQGDVVAHYGETTVTLMGVPYANYADDGIGLFAV